MPLCKVDDVRLYYEDYGAKNGIPLIFIHGGAWTNRWCSQIWKPQVDHFKDKRRVVLFDLRGYGQSDKPQEQYTMRRFSEDLFFLMKNLAIEKAIIVGYSIGGRIALRFVLDHQEMVERLVVISQAARRISFVNRLLLPLLLDFQMRNLPPDGTPEYVIRSSWSSAFKSDFSTELAKIQVPTLIILGSKEKKLTEQNLVNEAKYMKENISNSKLIIIEGADHDHPVKMPERTWQAIEEFIGN
jgi:pimeloyl-ACP methyl ester carboxylesterase